MTASVSNGSGIYLASDGVARRSDAGAAVASDRQGVRARSGAIEPKDRQPLLTEPNTVVRSRCGLVVDHHDLTRRFVGAVAVL
jgi:hypothetical protein